MYCNTLHHSVVQYSTVQCSAVQYSAVQCSTVQYSTVQCSAVQYSTLQYIALQYSTVQYIAVQCSTVHCITVHYSAVQYSAVQYSTVQCSAVQYSPISHTRTLQSSKWAANNSISKFSTPIKMFSSTDPNNCLRLKLLSKHTCISHISKRRPHALHHHFTQSPLGPSLQPLTHVHTRTLTWSFHRH